MSATTGEEHWLVLRQRLDQLSRMQATADPDAVLAQRARQLAVPLQNEEQVARVALLVFELSGERYALSPYRVVEVVPLRQLTPVPCTPGYILGVVAVRGRLVSVLDLRQFFELPLRSLSERNSVILISDGRMEFGLLCDSLCGTQELPLEQILPPLRHRHDSREGYLLGVTAEHWAILDTEVLLGDPRLVVNQQV
ncbi:chemotaxis protein CheW [Pokkaliibacter sp. MBI-7]|uniref:chemotaxis protein CheW n=1 Tax=Pokkaliibacter sp. MBI-7 TaxID=3040600 RepID=UPI0024483ECF|nr:chemotaxis protein CheW [Pokkaliibacter sp. MBI-7]MDH2432387.1 chemotaxis protein CheW [Pokkaliibacter sp. MBI-7]